jgi:hypothetical protein
MGDQETAPLQFINGVLSFLGAIRLAPPMCFFSIPALERLITEAVFKSLESESLLFDEQRPDQTYVVARFNVAKKI